MPEAFNGAVKKGVLKISENFKQNTCGEFTVSKATDFCSKGTPPRVYIFLNLMLELPKAKFRTLSRGQPQSLDVNHYVVLSSLEPQVTGSIVKRLGP